MDRPPTSPLRIGAWYVNPASGQISRDGETARVEVRTMRLLLCLAEHAGQVVSIDDLLTQVWSDVIVAPDSVYQAVTSLRRLLGDDPKNPTYIATVPRLGYRMVAQVSPWTDPSVASSPAPAHPNATPNSSQSRPSHNESPISAAPNAADSTTNSRPRLRPGYTLAAAVALCLALIVALLVYGKLTSSTNPSASPAVAPQPQKSIAVLPFLDLTDAMSEEPFADGMTEELIDKLSKIPGLRVPPPTASFYYKSKLWPRSDSTSQITILEIAKQLGVVYVLDGSVRKSGSRVRIDARLIRADNGFVIWSESYDRPFDDLLMVQDDIATEVTKALKASIESTPAH
jgi:transcriptional activator of cad operon